MTHYIGIDLGGTKIAGGILDTANDTLAHKQIIPTEAQHGPDHVLQRIAVFVQQLAADAELTREDVAGIGVGMPATMDIARGITYVMPNLPGDWYEKPVVAVLNEKLKHSVSLINDARAFTLAEASLGAGRGAETVACLTLGTGIGGGIAIGGQLHLGLSGSAGEIGHMSIDYNGLPDGAGSIGGLEGYASGPAIAAMGAKAVRQGITTSIGQLVDYDLNRITPQTIMLAAKDGDPIALDILRRAGLYIGTAIVNIMAVVSPNRIVIGGGVAQLGDWILQPIIQTVHERCKTAPLDQLEIVQAALGEDAGFIGAATWARQQAEA